MKDTGSLRSGTDLGAVTLTDDQVRRARRYVAGAAADVEDARMLIDMLGLMEKEK